MGKYQIIYADPPWSYRSGKVQGQPKIITQPCRTNSCTNFRYLRWLLIPVFYFYGVLFPNCRKR